MRLLRPLLVMLAAVSLLAAPGAVSASANAGPDSKATATAKAAEPPFSTTISFRPTDHVRAYGSVTAIRGQVLSDHGLGVGSIPATVELLRRYKGSPTWVSVRRATTTNPSAPVFAFDLRTNANAFYRVVFAGDDKNLASSASTTVWAYRKISTQLKPRLLEMYGKVAPRYAGKRMVVERKTCATCTYVRVRSTVVNAKSNYRVTLKAPARGRWFWRLATPAGAEFITSYSGVVTTTQN